jgi:hypothetical protein
LDLLFLSIFPIFSRYDKYKNPAILSSMTLTTHAIVGAAIAASMPNHPVIGFTLAFASHFILDAIPHWDYKLSSQKTDGVNPLNDDMIINKDFFVDLSKIGLDAGCGILLVLLVFTLYSPHLFWIPLVGVFGAILPDALQFVYFKWRHQPLTSLQRFHIWIHAKHRLDDKPFVGVLLQIALIAIVIFISKFH